MKVYALRYRCPDIKTMEDAEIVREMLGHLPGVGEIEVDFRTHEVRVVTSSQDEGREVLARLLASEYPPEE